MSEETVEIVLTVPKRLTGLGLFANTQLEDNATIQTSNGLYPLKNSKGEILKNIRIKTVKSETEKAIFAEYAEEK